MTIIKIALGLLISVTAVAQQSPYSLPRDARNTPLYTGLGLPVLTELTVGNTTYDDTHKITLPTTGASLNRVFAHFWVWNANTTDSVYFCFGTTAALCTANHIKVRPSAAFVDDFAWFGDAVGTPYIFYKCATSASVDVRVW